MKCKICGSESIAFDSATILNKYEVQYYRCPDCGFIQTEEPYWLDEAYSSAITSSDIGLVQRNVSLSRKIDVIFRTWNVLEDKSFLDYGGGYGMFVRMMRDYGWNFEWYDEYCDNLFAQTHERSLHHYDFITSFEMLEHLPDPYETLDKIFALCETAIFTTELLPDPVPKVIDWWYYGLDHGQHISFYTLETMKIIANRYKKHYFAAFGLHFFSSKYKMLSKNRIKICLMIPQLAKALLPSRKSLLPGDYFKLTGKRLG